MVARIALAAGIEINDAKDPIEPIGRRLSGAPVLLVLVFEPAPDTTNQGAITFNVGK